MMDSRFAFANMPDYLGYVLCQFTPGAEINIHVR